MLKPHEIMKKYLIGICKGYSNSLVVCSPAGYGKTELTLSTLKELGLEENEHYKYISNYITPVELYLLLEEVNQLKEPRILVLDDVEDTLTNQRSIGLLKGALWSSGGKRIVGWRSGSYRIKNKEIEFTGRIIFLLNQINKKSAIVRALIDRGLFFEMKLTLQDMFELMRQRAELPYLDIPYNKRKEIVQFLSKVGGSSQNITLRLLPKAFQLYKLSPNHYQHLVMELL